DAGIAIPPATPPAPDAGAADSGTTPAPDTIRPDPGFSANPTLPLPRGPCPAIETGEQRFANMRVRLWVGPLAPSPNAPLLLYYFGTGSSPAEVETMLGDTLTGILDLGGIVAAPTDTLGVGSDVGPGTWFTGDADIADEIVACVNAQRALDPRRIYTAGCSAGGLMAGALTYLRSRYIAAAMLNSGGSLLEPTLEEPGHVPAVIAAHGREGYDLVIVDYAKLSLGYTEKLAAQGGFAVDCDHGGGHCGVPAAMREAQWQFLMEHPFAILPSPYANGLPTSFPRACRVLPTP
ncbi:MAG: hypothetical protein ABW321_33835, partial [Polyangiales bacterium]